MFDVVQFGVWTVLPEMGCPVHHAGTGDSWVLSSIFAAKLGTIDQPLGLTA